MPEYRNANDGRDTPHELNARDRRATWAWIAGAVAIVILLAFVVDVSQSHPPTLTGPNVAANNALNQGPPTGPASRTYTPTPMNPATPPPLNPAHPQPQH